tara:strand:- start:104 stop:406 length:303 start_codon:yes stop_codon:yes gene_type:complete
MGSIEQYTVTNAVITSIRLDGGSRTIIRADGNDLNIAYQRQYLATGQFFTIKDGEAFVFDPNPVTGDTMPELGAVFHVQAATAVAPVVVQVWLQGMTQGA